MANWGSQVVDYFDRNYFPYTLGSSVLATIMSIIQDYGLVVTSLVCTSIAPLIFKAIALWREGRRDKELLRHEVQMHRLAEKKAELEIQLLIEANSTKTIIHDDKQPNQEPS